MATVSSRTTGTTASRTSIATATTTATGTTGTTSTTGTTGTTTKTAEGSVGGMTRGAVVGSTRLRRTSLLGKRVSVAEKGKQEEVKVTVSPSKKRRYTMAVSRPVAEPEVHPSYTYTPSSDRRLTLDTLLMKSGKMQSDSDSSLNSSLNKCG